MERIQSASISKAVPMSCAEGVIYREVRSWGTHLDDFADIHYLARASRAKLGQRALVFSG